MNLQQLHSEYSVNWAVPSKSCFAPPDLDNKLFGVSGVAIASVSISLDVTLWNHRLCCFNTGLKRNGQMGGTQLRAPRYFHKIRVEKHFTSVQTIDFSVICLRSEPPKPPRERKCAFYQVNDLCSAFNH